MASNEDQDKNKAGKKKEPKKKTEDVSEPQTDTAEVNRAAPEVEERRIVPFVNRNPTVQNRTSTGNMIFNLRVGVQIEDIFRASDFQRRRCNSTANNGDKLSNASIQVISASVTAEENSSNPVNATELGHSSKTDPELNIQSPIPSVKSEDQKKSTCPKIKRRRPRARSPIKAIANKRDSNPGKERVSKKIFDVDKILNKRTRAGKVEYLLRWTGYSKDKDSWESPEHMECSELIEIFERQRDRDRDAKRGAINAIKKLSQTHDSSSSTDSDSKKHSIRSSFPRKRVKKVTATVDQDTKPMKKPVKKRDRDSSSSSTDSDLTKCNIRPSCPIPCKDRKRTKTVTTVVEQEIKPAKKAPLTPSPATPSSSKMGVNEGNAGTSQDHSERRGSSSPSSMEANCSGTNPTSPTPDVIVSFQSRYQPGIFPVIDLSSVGRSAPVVLKPLAIVLTKVDRNRKRWYLVFWENYMYPFAWVGEEYIKTNFIDMVIRFYELLLSRYCP